MKLSTIVGWAMVACLTLFVFINWRPAYINFLWIIKTEMPISLAMIISAAMGFLAATFFRMYKKDNKH